MPNTRKTADDYSAAGARIGMIWIGDLVSPDLREAYLPRNRKELTTWGCPEHGVTVRASLAKLRTWSRSACPTCRGPYIGRRRMDENDYRKLAEDHGLEWVAEEIPRSTTFVTSWCCPKGHRFERSYQDVCRRPACPRCGPRARKVIEDYVKLAKERGFTWIGGALPLDTHTPTRWRCSKGHKWMARYDKIQHERTGCPKCADMVNGRTVSRPQRKIASMVSGVLNHPFGRHFIDVALPDDQIAIEYDCAHWHDRIPIEKAVKRDRLLLSKGWHVLHIRAEITEIPDASVLATHIDLLKTGGALALSLFAQ